MATKTNDSIFHFVNNEYDHLFDTFITNNQNILVVFAIEGHSIESLQGIPYIQNDCDWQSDFNHIHISDRCLLWGEIMGVLLVLDSSDNDVHHSIAVRTDLPQLSIKVVYNQVSWYAGAGDPGTITVEQVIEIKQG